MTEALFATIQAVLEFSPKGYGTGNQILRNRAGRRGRASSTSRGSVIGMPHVCVPVAKFFSISWRT